MLIQHQRHPANRVAMGLAVPTAAALRTMIQHPQSLAQDQRLVTARVRAVQASDAPVSKEVIVQHAVAVAFK